MHRYRIRETYTGNGKPTIQRVTMPDTKSYLLKRWRLYKFCLPDGCPEGYTDCYLELVRDDGQIDKRTHCNGGKHADQHGEVRDTDRRDCGSQK